MVMKILDLVAANYAHARNADAISKVARDAGKAKGPSDVDYRVMVETAKNNGELRGSRIESAGDYHGDDRPGSKARNEAERRARIEYARNNPADYLRRFGRVREINANDTNTESGSVRSGKAGD